MKQLFGEWLLVIKGRPRLFGWFAGLACLVCLVDFLTRIQVLRDAESRRFTAPVMQTMPREETAAVIQTRLTTALPEIRPVDEAAEVKPRDVALQGVFMSRGLRTAVLVLLPQGDKPMERHNVQSGGEIDGWLVERITGTRVTLRKGSETRELVMFRGKVE